MSTDGFDFTGWAQDYDLIGITDRVKCPGFCS